MNQPVQIKPQVEFPLIKEYAQYFDITPRTIFAWNNAIYTNYALPNDLLIHERTHLEQQEREGLEHWVKNYLNNPEYRLKQEIEAYKHQLSMIKDREYRNKIRLESIETLCSSLYGNIISKDEAEKILKITR
jgi:DNA-binding Xre family transcriptional regulator